MVYNANKNQNNLIKIRAKLFRQRFLPPKILTKMAYLCVFGIMKLQEKEKEQQVVELIVWVWSLQILSVTRGICKVETAPKRSVYDTYREKAEPI